MSATDVLVDCMKSVYGFGLCVTVPTNMLLYAVFLWTDTNTIVDFGWALMQLLLGCLCFWLRQQGLAYGHLSMQGGGSSDKPSFPLRNAISLVVLALWAARLGGFILLNRVLRGENDQRYEALALGRRNAVQSPLGRKMSDVAPQSKGGASTSQPLGGNRRRRLFFFLQFLMQSILVVFPATPVYFIFGYAEQDELHGQWSFWLGLAIVVFGIVNVTISDSQVEAYKAEQKTQQRGNDVSVKKGLCKTGWWKRSRHPNLFFEIVTWVGFAMMGIDVTTTYVSLFALVGPVLLYIIMRFLTVPVTERQMARSRPDWNQLIVGTNMFFPL